MLYTIIVILGILADQAFKFWIVGHLPLDHHQAFLPGLVSLHHIHNFGAAWGFFSHSRLLLLSVSLLASLLLIHLIRQESARSPWLSLGYCLILSGAIGNGLDRLRLGYVVDMLDLDFMSFPIFNLADCLISVGAGLLVVLYIGMDLLSKKEEI